MAKEKKSGFVADFKKFISRGNVVDMAVGVVVGGAFSKIVTGFVNYIINPFIGIFIKNGSLDSIKTVINEATYDEAGEILTKEVAILWGTWLQTIIDFLIIALCIFCVVRIINKVRDAAAAKENAEKAAAEAEAAQKAKEEADAAAAALAAEAEAKAAEDARLRASLLAQEALLTEIRDAIRNK